jgi:hypothetical protein
MLICRTVRGLWRNALAAGVWGVRRLGERCSVAGRGSLPLLLGERTRPPRRELTLALAHQELQCAPRQGTSGCNARVREVEPPDEHIWGTITFSVGGRRRLVGYRGRGVVWEYGAAAKTLTAAWSC